MGQLIFLLDRIGFLLTIYRRYERKPYLQIITFQLPRCTRDALGKIASLRHSMNKCIIYFQHHLFAVIWGVMWVLEVIRADVRRADSILAAPVPLR
jgi:hypothetical protein